MNKILTLLYFLLLIISCGGYNPPQDPDNGSASTPTVDFSYILRHPFYAHFNNMSDVAPQYKWDFGDGCTSTEKSPTHKYKSKGVYKVVLIIGDGNNNYKVEKNVTIKEPTKCYVSGIVYENIPKNNEYYKIRFTDDYLIFETLYWHTDWVLLSSNNIPYTYNLKSKKQIDFNKSEYVVRLYQNGSTSGDGEQKAKWNVYPADIKAKYLESVTGSVNNAKVTLLFEWTD